MRSAPGASARAMEQPIAGPAGVAALPHRVESEIAYMRELLGHLIEFAGMSRREVEKRLVHAGCGTDLGRVLNGRLALKVEHLLAICSVLELDPREFFDMAFKRWPRRRSPLLRRLEALLPAVRTALDEARDGVD